VTAWRAKRMPVAEWVSFQNAYEKLFVATGGDNRMALFVQRNLGDENSILLIPAHNADSVERLSPGGWEDHGQPSGPNISLLVGNASAADDFGVQLGVRG
jgi:hypothetical protein